jgi:hypothetical protein
VLIDGHIALINQNATRHSQVDEKVISSIQADHNPFASPPNSVNPLALQPGYEITLFQDDHRSIPQDLNPHDPVPNDLLQIPGYGLYLWQFWHGWLLSVLSESFRTCMKIIPSYARDDDLIPIVIFEASGYRCQN